MTHFVYGEYNYKNKSQIPEIFRYTVFNMNARTKFQNVHQNSEKFFHYKIPIKGQVSFAFISFSEPHTFSQAKARQTRSLLKTCSADKISWQSFSLWMQKNFIKPPSFPSLVSHTQKHTHRSLKRLFPFTGETGVKTEAENFFESGALGSVSAPRATQRERAREVCTCVFLLFWRCECVRRDSNAIIIIWKE